MSDLISRQAVIDMVKGWNLNQHIMNEEDALDDVNALPSADQCMIVTATSNTMVSDTVKIPIMDGTTEGLPSVKPEVIQWETCFDCPLSHGCSVINGCTNEQAMECAGEIPDNCPLNTKTEHPKGEWIATYSDCGGDAFVWVSWKCSNCDYVRKKGWKNTDDGKKPDALFCEICGADMRGE